MKGLTVPGGRVNLETREGCPELKAVLVNRKDQGRVTLLTVDDSSAGWTGFVIGYGRLLAGTLKEAAEVRLAIQVATRVDQHAEVSLSIMLTMMLRLEFKEWSKKSAGRSTTMYSSVLLAGRVEEGRNQTWC